MKRRYDTSSFAWKAYRARMLALKQQQDTHSRATYRALLKMHMKALKPVPLAALGEDELKLAQIAEDDGYTIVAGVGAELQLAKEALEETNKRVNAVHNPDVPETQEEIDAAWQRHKDFFGR